MKTFKYSFIATCFVLVCLSCKKEMKIEYIPELKPGGEVLAVMVSPTERTIYADSNVPMLKAFCVPENAADTTLVWSSSNENVLKVNSKTGRLEWGKVQNTEVFITATNPKSGKSGSCKFEVKNEFGVYKYIDVTKELGFWILDRNVGATAAGNPYVDNDRSVAGDYFHFQFNTPVANREFGGPDGKGGRMYYYGSTSDSWSVIGGYPAFNRFWTGYEPEASDWTVPEQTPCPKGWRLPTLKEFENIIYKTNPENFASAQEKGAAKLLLKKLQLVNAGYLLLPSGWFESSNAVLWSSDRDNSTKKTACLNMNFWPLIKGSADYIVGQIKKVDSPYDGIHGIAMPIRCIRSATPEIPD